MSPALLGLWGTKLMRRDSHAGEPDRWYRLAQQVMRRPGLVAALTSAVMIAAALPALGAVWSSANDSSVIPRGDSARTVADAVVRDFAGAGKSPVTVAIHAPASATAAVNSFAGRVAGVSGVTRVDPPRLLGSSTWQLNAAVAGDSAGVTAQRVVDQIRATPSFETKVTGNAAAFIDQPNAIGSHLPQAIGLLVVLTFNTPEAGDALHNLRATYGREWQEEPVPE